MADSKEEVVVELSFTSWLHPAALVCVVTGLTALAAVALPAEDFAQWETPKYIDGARAALIFLGIGSLCSGIWVGSSVGRSAESARLVLGELQVRRLVSVYRVLVALTVIGYLIWIASGATQGVGLAQLQSVVEQQEGAISSLKENARPIAGVTTLTQFGPMAALLGFFLRREGYVSRLYLIVPLLAVVRALFYAERLAVIEVCVPLVLFAAMTSQSSSSVGRRLIRLMPIYAVPALWSLFSIFEYFRSWTVLQYQTSDSFFRFTSLRLLGYYVTSFNNSALFDEQLQSIPDAGFPYQTFPFVWNAPVIGDLLGEPTYVGLSSPEWIKAVLALYASPDYNNKGSFLLSHGELGTIGMVALWGIFGLLIGLLYRVARRGSVPAAFSYCVLSIGLLELPRIIYWTEGRSIPVFISCLAVYFAMRKSADNKSSQRVAMRSI